MDEGIKNETMPCRVKYWCELDVEGKLERIRQVLRGVNTSIDECINSNRLFHEHRHLPDGRAAVSINEKMQGLSLVRDENWDAVQKGEVYF